MHLNATMLDRLHFVMASLKQRGVYWHLPLHFGRTYCNLTAFLPVDSGPDSIANPCPEITTFDKAVAMVVPEALESQKRFAMAFLNSSNPYTGRTIVSDPALAVIELSNEDSLTMYWSWGAIDKASSQYPDLQRHLEHKWAVW